MNPTEIEMHNCCPSCGHTVFGNAWEKDGNAVCRKCNRVFYFTVGQPGIYQVPDIPNEELQLLLNRVEDHPVDFYADDPIPGVTFHNLRLPKDQP